MIVKSENAWIVKSEGKLTANQGNVLLLPNPNRSFAINPLAPTKIDDLMKSINTTGFWDNVVITPVQDDAWKARIGEMTTQEYLASLPADHVLDFPAYLCYGHHRVAALAAVGLTEMNVPCKDVTDEQLLLMMAFENKGDWTHAGILVMIETVRQVKDQVQATLDACASFEDYQAAGHTFFKDSKAFKNAKSQGVGYRAMLGIMDGWTESDIRPAMTAIEHVDSDIYTLQDIGGIPSAGVLNEFNKLAKQIRAQKAWPTYVQKELVTEAANYIKAPDKGATLKTVRLAANHAKNGSDVMTYLDKQQPKPFNLEKYIEGLITDTEGAGDIRTLEGMSDFEDLIQKVEAHIEEKNLAKKKQQTAPEADTDTSEVVAPEADGDFNPQEALEDAVYDETGGAPQAGDSEGDPDFAIEEEDKNLVFARSFANASEPMIAQADNLMMVIGEMDKNGQYAPFFKSLNDSFNTITSLMIYAYGAAEAKKAIDKVATKLAG